MTTPRKGIVAETWSELPCGCVAYVDEDGNLHVRACAIPGHDAIMEASAIQMAADRGMQVRRASDPPDPLDPEAA